MLRRQIANPLIMGLGALHHRLLGEANTEARSHLFVEDLPCRMSIAGHQFHNPEMVCLVSQVEGDLR